MNNFLSFVKKAPSTDMSSMITRMTEKKATNSVLQSSKISLVKQIADSANPT